MKHSPKTFKKLNPQLCAIDSSKVHPALTSVFSYCFYKAAFRLRELLHKELAPHDLIGPHVGLLRLLETLGPHSQNDLAEQMSIDKATMVKLIDHLEKKKFVLRRPDKTDRRVKHVEITKQGKATLGTASQLRKELEQRFLSVLDANERAVLLKAIPKLLLSDR